MKVIFRADASLEIGTGHVMRCLTLADALAQRGAQCQFICRAHPGHLLDLIRSRGHMGHALPVGEAAASPADATAHAQWLGATQAEDAAACRPILAQTYPDWLVVDHYALDASWERALGPDYRRLLVIDDLADRVHACDVLLDQTFGREPEDYSAWVPAGSTVLCGSQYALLRPEFASLRPRSLERRGTPQLRQLLVTLGGVDKDNVTGRVLDALSTCSLPTDCRITVVMGATAPRLQEVEQQALHMPWPTRVLVGVSNMAQLMADSDLAIGAAGATSWERCCLGLPTIMVVLADNQRLVAQGLALAGAVKVIERAQDVARQLPLLLAPLIESPPALQRMSQSAMSVADGRGVDTVIRVLES